MTEECITVTVEGEKREYRKGTAFLSIAEEYQEKKSHDIVLAYEGDRLRELRHRVEHPCSISFLTTGDKLGFGAYKRSMVLLLMKAIYHEGGHKNIRKAYAHYAVGNGYYCTVEGDLALTQEFLDRVKAYMTRLVSEKVPIEKKSVSTDEAISLFGDYGMKDKEKLFHYRRVSRVNLYSIGDFEDYNYGYMVPNTSYLRYFDLKLYDDGLCCSCQTA